MDFVFYWGLVLLFVTEMLIMYFVFVNSSRVTMFSSEKEQAHNDNMFIKSFNLFIYIFFFYAGLFMMLKHTDGLSTKTFLKNSGYSFRYNRKSPVTSLF